MFLDTTKQTFLKDVTFEKNCDFCACSLNSSKLTRSLNSSKLPSSLNSSNYDLINQENEGKKYFRVDPEKAFL